MKNKHILLGISGGIAAYKSAELTAAYVKQGAEVRVVMTAGAQAFITPLTLQALSGNPVHSGLLNPEEESAFGHIDLARWADYVLIALPPRKLIAKITAGLADDLLSTLCLAHRSPDYPCTCHEPYHVASQCNPSQCENITTTRRTVYWPLQQVAKPVAK